MQALKPDWDSLFLDQTDCHLFCSYGWIYNCYTSAPTTTAPLLLVAFEGRSLVGVFPFAVRDYSIKGFKLRALVHAASDRADYASFLISRSANERVAVNRAIEKLTGLQEELGWQLYVLENLSETDLRTNLFRDSLVRSTHGGIISTTPTPRILFDRPYEEAKKVSNVKRRFKKLADARSIVETIGGPVTPELLQRLGDLHRQSHPAGSFGSPAGQAFFNSLLCEPNLQSLIDVSTIEDGPNLVAAHFGFRCAQRLLYYIPMYDEHYAQYGPGQYLLWRMISHYRQAGFREFDFLRGGEDYKYQWMNASSANYTFMGVSNSATFWMKWLVSILLARNSHRQVMDFS